MSLQILLLHQFEQQQAETWDVRFSLDGKQLVSSDGNALHLWQLYEGGNWVYERSLPFSRATFPRFSPSGQMLAFGGEAAFIQLISVDGRKMATLSCPPHADWAFSPDQRWLVSSSMAPEILLWDLATLQHVSLPIVGSDERKTAINLLQSRVGSFQFAPDGQRLVFGASSADGYVHVCQFDPARGHLALQKSLPLDGILQSTITRDGKLLAILDVRRGEGPYETEIFLYDLESLRLIRKLPRTTGGRYSLLAASPDSRFLLSSKDDGSVDIWSLSSFECVASFAAHPGLTAEWSDPIGGLDWSQTGDIVTGGASVFESNPTKKDYTIKIWKVEGM